MYKRRISILLMVLTIGTIVAFQAFWLRKSYAEEKRLFTIRTNLLFRETILKLEASKLHLDTSINFSFQERPGMTKLARVMLDKQTKDSSGKLHEQKTFVITMNHEDTNRGADPAHRIQLRVPDARAFDFLSNIDSLIEPVTASEISARYLRVLDKEAIHLPFRIKATPVVRDQNNPPRSGLPGSELLDFDQDDSKVVTSLGRRMAYELHFDNSGWYVARRIGPQALFSLVLVGFTLLSFLSLYRNWQQQRRLTLLKNDFISNITHELKTPIATLSVAVEALKNFNALHDPARTQEYLDISSNELQRLSLLVDKVLKLSLFEREEIELKKDHFDLKVLVEEVMASMRLQFEKYQARLTLEVQDGEEDADFYLKADKLHITSVIFNLLDNALKYSRQDPAIQIRLASGRGQLLLSVTDNGLGIPAAYMNRIFEKFFRVPTGDRHNVKGYGLGLSYVSYVLQRQGGEISVESQEGAGSRFTVKIPREHV
ncbi:MAG TPA: HAMP domain-containing sensor histidine kinase [Puia sp.]|nr:HAMP domain-containing sensor histidine kinase [Puia sp.]